MLNLKLQMVNSTNMAILYVGNFTAHIIINKQISVKYFETLISCLAYSGKVWQIDSFRAFGERKFDELIDQPMGY